jgi:predicted phosphohydrolase
MMEQEVKLFAMADLHLSFFKEKPMSIFGEVWLEHHKKIEENWKKTVSPQDTVLIPGDISWAMSMEEAMPDLEFIDSLPGKKILLKGNHDYWWGSVSRLNTMFKTMRFLQNDFYMWQSFAICGSRGWLVPDDPRFGEGDLKTYNRELKRYELSLAPALKKNCDGIIFMSHYPPVYRANTETEFAKILEKYGVKKAVYGHLHGEDSFLMAAEGNIGGVEYSLVSSDYLGFAPKRIL